MTGGILPNRPSTQRYDAAILAELARRPYLTARDVAQAVGTSNKHAAGRLARLERRRRVRTGALLRGCLTWAVRG